MSRLWSAWQGQEDNQHGASTLITASLLATATAHCDALHVLDILDVEAFYLNTRCHFALQLKFLHSCSGALVIEGSKQQILSSLTLQYSAILHTSNPVAGQHVNACS